ncbi:uncharacterized protein J4E88_007993 [Alternaria novae-zelandiae]|uniref:uncharacterized protein n=1 Tax=Alternaria novae-zelandiae TaxID=430562 RepID=UPI0020C3967C|nr:uncharacterized protein J4E88_007993 [Alternaria novae-zelandiae]KAI4675089.1 hypothetical protein J4E88_007993 [Alternaria novae-zelandiae]
MLKPGNPPTISLTQVCRQIRDEFRKIYMQNVSFTVRDKDIKRFTNAFFASGHTNQRVLDGQRPSRVIYLYPPSMNVDILPLVELKMAYPQTEVTVIPGPADIEEQPYSQFNYLPAELRNRIYDFAAETEADQPRCVLPCLALAQSCQQLRTEYRSICLKRDIVIDWKAVAGYMRTFFPTVDGKIENVELAPANMTIVTPWRGKTEDTGGELDLLPLVKFGLCRPNFACHFIHDTKILERAEKEADTNPHSDGRNFRGYIKDDTEALEGMMGSRNPKWLSDIETGVITKLIAFNIGVSDPPQATFYLKRSLSDFETHYKSYEETLFEEFYFESIGADAFWGEFERFPEIKFE